MISVVACSNRPEFIPRLLGNFHKQNLKEKELILVLHGAAMNMEVEATGLKVLRYPAELSLGECLNKGTDQANYEYVAKMDDDDYYGCGYLEEAFAGLIQTGADLVGKCSFYIYFQRNQELRLYNPQHEQRWIENRGPYQTADFLSGATMVFKRELLERNPFPAVNIGEDSSFQQQCYQNGAKIYSLSKNHYTYIRYSNPSHHHSDATDHTLKKRSQLITRF